MDMKQLGAEVVAACKQFFERKLVGIAAQIDELTLRVNALPKPKDGAPGRDGIDGKQGDPGIDGVKGDPGADGAAGRDGVDGKDAAPGQRGEDGREGSPGLDGAPGERGEKGEAGEKGERGEPGLAGEQGLPGERGADGEKGNAGEAGKDGEDGRDALDLDVLSMIDETKRYRRGTFASHKGGLWRAVRTTEGMDGWECIVNGVNSVDLVQGEEAKTYALKVEMSDGATVGTSFALPVMIYRGVFREGDEFTPGDTVTWGGSLWHCNETTKDKPNDGTKAWTLAAKKGRDGRDGENSKNGGQK